MRISSRLVIFICLIRVLNCQTYPSVPTNSPNIHITYKHLQPLAPLKSTVIGRTLRTENEGLTYTFPEGFVTTPQDKLPTDSTHKEVVLLALWDPSHRTPVPRLVLLWNMMVRPNFTPETIATHALKNFPLPADAKSSEIKTVKLGGNTFWRMDYLVSNEPDQAYNTAIIIPLADRRVLLFQMNAASQDTLNVLANSLNSLKLDDNSP